MAKRVTAYEDNKGALHRDPEEATIADLSAILGHVSGAIGLSHGLARKLIERRHEIEQVFAQHDKLSGAVVKLVGRGR